MSSTLPTIMVRLLLSTLLVGSQLAAVVLAESVPVDEVTQRDQVLSLMQGYEWRLPADQLSNLPGDVYLDLIALAQGEDGALNIPAYIKTRAVKSLSLYPNTEVWQFLQARLEATSKGQRRRTLEVMCHGFLDPSQVDVMPADSPATASMIFANNLMPMLDGADADLRTIAAQCLKRINQISPSAEITQAMGNYSRVTSAAWERRAAGLTESTL